MYLWVLNSFIFEVVVVSCGVVEVKSTIRNVIHGWGMGDAGGIQFAAVA